jgi:ribonuclease HI
MAQLKEVPIYTDGACLGNPGPGGYGAVLLYGPHRREISGGFRLTTNNRMEIMAVIAALEALKEPCRVTLHSDSQYVVNAMTQGWARRWRANGWKRNQREEAVNPDLWERLLDLCDQHQVEFQWLRGHSGIDENERCDQLAVDAARQPDLPEDTGYKSPA